MHFQERCSGRFNTLNYVRYLMSADIHVYNTEHLSDDQLKKLEKGHYTPLQANIPSFYEFTMYIGLFFMIFIVLIGSILGEYSYRAGVCMNQEINLAACLLEIAQEAKWKSKN